MRPPSKTGAPSSSTSSGPATIITYRCDGEMAYVVPAKEYQEAIAFAQETFPQLYSVDSRRISLSVYVNMGSGLRVVRIAPMAWTRVAASLAKYEVVEIKVMPSALDRAAKSETDIHSPVASHSIQDEIPPPSYLPAAPSTTTTMTGTARGTLTGTVTNSEFERDVKKQQQQQPLHVDTSRLAPPPSDHPGNKRPSSAHGWFSRR